MNGGLVFRDNGITSHMAQTNNVASHAAAILEERIVRYTSNSRSELSRRSPSYYYYHAIVATRQLLELHRVPVTSVASIRIATAQKSAH